MHTTHKSLSDSNICAVLTAGRNYELLSARWSHKSYPSTLKHLIYSNEANIVSGFKILIFYLHSILYKIKGYNDTEVCVECMQWDEQVVFVEDKSVYIKWNAPLWKYISSCKHRNIQIYILETLITAAMTVATSWAGVYLVVFILVSPLKPVAEESYGWYECKEATNHMQPIAPGQYIKVYERHPCSVYTSKAEQYSFYGTEKDCNKRYQSIALGSEATRWYKQINNCLASCEFG